MAVGGATCSQARHRRTSVLHKLYSGMVRDIERTHPSEHYHSRLFVSRTQTASLRHLCVEPRLSYPKCGRERGEARADEHALGREQRTRQLVHLQGGTAWRWSPSTVRAELQGCARMLCLLPPHHPAGTLG